MGEVKVVKLTDMQWKVLEPYLKREEDANVGFQSACSFVRVSNEKVWEVIQDLFPEIKGKRGSIDKTKREMTFIECEGE